MLEEEVERWLLALDDEAFGQAERSIDLLAEQGFHLGRQQIRITYYVATGCRIVLLTVFTKTRQRERTEVQRAWRAMQACIAEDHTAEERRE